MPAMARKTLTLIALAAASALTLGGCSLAGGGSDKPVDLTFTLWDATVAEAYEESFAAFEKANENISVTVTVTPWDEYWSTLRSSVADHTAADVFWVNDSSYSAFADSGNIMNITDTLGTGASRGWEPSVVKQYTRDGSLWGVPQLYDAGIAVYYNADLLKKAGVDPAELNDLNWSPTDAKADTYLPLAKKLTVDAKGVAAGEAGFDGTPVQYGTGLSDDGQAILLPFIGSNGGVFQTEGKFAFTDPKSVEAIDYLVNAITKEKVAPPVSADADSGNAALAAFLDGKVATYQSGVYNLKNVSEGADFDWGVAELPAGPEGRVSVTNGIIAAANATVNDDRKPAVKKLLEWLGSTEGASYLGGSGAAIPGVVAAQSTFTDYWTEAGIDVEPFFSVIGDNATIPAFSGPKFADGQAAYQPIFDEIFSGKLEVKDGLKKAQDAGNAAIAG